MSGFYLSLRQIPQNAREVGPVGQDLFAGFGAAVHLNHSASKVFANATGVPVAEQADDESVVRHVLCKILSLARNGRLVGDGHREKLELLCIAKAEQVFSGHTNENDDHKTLGNRSSSA